MDAHLIALEDSRFAWPPEPLRGIGATLTRNEMARADRNDGRRGLWLKLLDRFELGFAC